MEQQSNLLHISKKAFLSVVLILFALMLIATILTYIIPAGAYLRDAEGLVVPNSFTFITSQTFPFWRLFTAPFEVLVSDDALNVIMIGLFLVILGGTFTLMDKTGAIHVIIKRLILKFKDNRFMLLRVVILFFMSFGAFFGIFEESLAVLPILILLSLSLGWDTMVGLGMSLLAAGFGFASAITNPFSIGIASSLAGVSLLSGIFYRMIIFIVMYALLQFFLVSYAKKIEKSPQLSYSFDADQLKVKAFDLNMKLPYPNEDVIFKSFVLLFVFLFLGILSTGLMELFFDLSIPAIPVMALIFLVGGLISGYTVSKDIKFTLKTFGSGFLSVLPAILLIMMAVSVKFIITEGQIMDTILYYLSNALSNRSSYVAVLFIYGLVLVIQFFIGSASAKAFLIMPLLIPLVTLIGLSREVAILAFVFGDGYTNVIFPTNAILLIGLSMASVKYSTWIKFTLKLQIITFILTIMFLFIAIYIGY